MSGKAEKKTQQEQKKNWLIIFYKKIMEEKLFDVAEDLGQIKQQAYFVLG